MLMCDVQGMFVTAAVLLLEMFQEEKASAGFCCH